MNAENCPVMFQVGGQRLALPAFFEERVKCAQVIRARYAVVSDVGPKLAERVMALDLLQGLAMLPPEFEADPLIEETRKMLQNFLGL